MDEFSDSICIYRSPANQRCKRLAIIGRFCPFHTRSDEDDTADTRGCASPLLDQLAELVDQFDGNWVGFIFPRAFRLSSIVSSQVITFRIDASYAQFQDFSFDVAELTDEFVAEHASFEGKCTAENTRFMNGLNLKDARFSGLVVLRNVKIQGSLYCYGAFFGDSFTLNGEVNGPSNFNESIFDGAASFSDLRQVSLSTHARSATRASASLSNKSDTARSVENVPARTLWITRLRDTTGRINLKIRSHLLQLKKYWSSQSQEYRNKYDTLRRRLRPVNDGVRISTLFYGDPSFEGVTFNNPKNVVFKGVNLTRARFLRTDVRDVRFVGNSWYQPSLRRDGLYDEVWLNTVDYNTRSNMLSALENTYRYIRLSLEGVKDYVSANDFYIGEMDARRNQMSISRKHCWSIAAIYNHLSRYGTSPLKITGWILLLCFFHALLVAKYVEPSIFEISSQYEFQKLGQWTTYGLELFKTNLIEAVRIVAENIELETHHSSVSRHESHPASVLF
jgi:uncharacterized protein YjbI with pentapeptide repeats